MREWIALFESESTITVYHGGHGSIKPPVRTPFWTTSVEEMARSYARQKGWGDGVLTSFQLDLTAKTATTTTIEQYATKNNIDIEGSHLADLIYDDMYKLVPDLIHEGYQIIFLHDFGYHDNFREEPTYIILDASVLHDMQELEKVESR